jgi:hypothetical protein
MSPDKKSASGPSRNAQPKSAAHMDRAMQQTIAHSGGKPKKYIAPTLLKERPSTLAYSDLPTEPPPPLLEPRSGVDKNAWSKHVRNAFQRLAMGDQYEKTLKNTVGFSFLQVRKRVLDTN